MALKEPLALKARKESTEVLVRLATKAVKVCRVLKVVQDLLVPLVSTELLVKSV